MKRLLPVFAIVLGCLLASVPAAGAAQRWGVTAINISPQIASDDDRYVAFQRRNGIPVVLDTETGEFHALRGALYCQPRDIGGGRVLLICPHHRPTGKRTGFIARTGPVEGGPTKPLAKSGKLEDAYEIGRNWVAVKIPADNRLDPNFGFLNWRDGRLAKYMAMSGAYAFGGVNLDGEKLKPSEARRFAPRFEVARQPDEARPHICRGSSGVVTDWRGELRFWWTSNRSVRLGVGGILFSTCQWYQSIRIGENWVTWSRGRSLHAYNLRTGRRLDRRFPAGSKITPMNDGVVIAKKLKDHGRYYTAFRVRFIKAASLSE